MKVGFWVIEYPEEGQPRMYGDPMMHLIMAINNLKKIIQQKRDILGIIRKKDGLFIR